jgi:thioredoxin-related protein
MPGLFPLQPNGASGLLKRHVSLLLVLLLSSIGTAFSEQLKTAPPNHSEMTKSAPASSHVPLVVLIHSRECPVCAKVRPELKELAQTYGSRIRFVMLDITDDKSKALSAATAKAMNLSAFFNLYCDTFPCVGIFDAENRTVRELCGFNPKDKYANYINQALAKSKT